MKRTLTVFLVFIFLTNIAIGQKHQPKQAAGEKPFELGLVDKIQSARLNETRTLNIYLHEGYSPDSATAYPVIYLLDGSANEDFIHIVGIVQFLTMIEAMPKSIVVGIANVDRRRDFTFPTTIEKDKEDYPTTGGSAKFISFVEKELQPIIQEKYKTTTKTIIGQSLGGLLAVDILLKHPGLFDNYIIVSPSLWWDNESLLEEAPKLLQDMDAGDKHVYISVGHEGKQMEDDAKQLVGVLNLTGKKNLQTHFVPLMEENHLTILHNSVYKCLQILYSKKEAAKK